MTSKESAGTVDLPVTPVSPAPSGSSEKSGPSRLTRNELVYGYVVAAELVTVGVLNLAITGGKGAPTHPETMLGVAAVAVSALVAPLLYFVRSRTVAGFAVIIAALFVSLPKVPDRLSLTHAFALVFPVAYALIVTQRQRRALKQQVRAAPASGGPAAGGPAAGGRERDHRPARGRSAGREQRGETMTASGPQRSARYTPPKARRGRR